MPYTWIFVIYWRTSSGREVDFLLDDRALAIILLQATLQIENDSFNLQG
ncbi:MAG: hypothetical protein ACREQ3_18720 [Candidatus Binatia bacterium]